MTPPAAPEAKGRAALIKRGMKIAGLALQVGAAVFIVSVFLRHYESISSQLRPDGRLLGFSLVIVICSTLTVAAIAYGWRALLEGGGYRQVFDVVARTNLAKYLPGNVLHYVGRQFFAQSLGRSQSEVLATSIGEIVVVVSAASILSVAAGLAAWTLLDGAVRPLLGFAALVAVGLPGALALGSRIPPLRRLGVVDALARQSVRAWLGAYAGYGVCALTGQLGFIAAVAAVAGIDSPRQALALAAAYGLAYIAGLVTPAAPGGIGVREAGLVMLAAGVAGEPVVFAAAVLHRIATMAAEALCYLATYSPKPRDKHTDG